MGEVEKGRKGENERKEEASWGLRAKTCRHTTQFIGELVGVLAKTQVDASVDSGVSDLSLTCDITSNDS